VPITYEYFLPVSATGIFQSNLGGTGQKAYLVLAAPEAFESALRARVLNEIELYEAEQARSIAQMRRDLALEA
jgi:uncharacterized glyoxalase superfamily metalloenzyme YdcJ